MGPVSYTFTKTFLTNHSWGEHDRPRTCTCYTVWDGDTLLGKFLYDLNKGRFGFADESYSIVVKRTFFFSIFVIIDEKTDRRVGEYKIPGYVGPFAKPKRLVWKEKTYTKMSYSLPDDPRDLFRLAICEYPDYKVVYSFHSDPVIMTNHWIKYRPLEGSVTVTDDNLFLLFAGFFLLEERLWELDDF